MKDSNQLWKEQQARMNQKAAGLDPTETFKPQASCDDAFEKGDGSYNWTDLDIVVQSFTPDRPDLINCGAIKFPNIPIPKGSVATAAKFRGWIIGLANDSANFKVYGNLVADPQDFCDLKHIISPIERPRTTAYVEVIEEICGVGWYEITGLEDVINEILALPDWTSGNAIALLFIANVVAPLGGWMITSWDAGNGGEHTPELEISWSPPTVPCEDWLTKAECEAANCYWYDEACHSTPYVPPIPPVDLPTIAGAGLAVVDVCLVGYYLLKRFKII